MNTSAVEKYSIWARVALREGVRQRAMRYQLVGSNVPAGDELIQVDGRAITQREMAQRTELLSRIARMSEDAFLEQMAGTWFNRFFAMRYMEVHDYLPSRTRIFSDANGQFRPQCIGEAAALDLPGLDQERVVACKLSGDDEALFHDIVLAQCAQLHEALPTVFDALDGADALMLPDHLLKSDGVCARLVTDLPDAEWESVEILGWAYQFFNAERKDEFFTSKRKATAADIAPATQLFTPEWIVRYMAENSLGRLWMLNNPGSELAAKMEYFIVPDAEHEDFIRVASPEDITVCDPACGSGHILSYAFELLFQMYEERGYRERDIPELILTQNLSGMEIDPRAAQIATLVLAMRAREHDRRFFSRGVTASIAVLESIEFTEDELAAVPSFAAKKELVDTLAHLGECGSLFAPTEVDLQVIRGALETLPEGDLFTRGVRGKLARALSACEALTKKHFVCIANPPYMGGSSFNPWLSKWIKKRYPDSCKDLCTAFIERGYELAEGHGYGAMVTMQSWMFLGSFEKMRNRIIDEKAIVNMAHLGTRAFDAIAGEVVSVTADVLYNSPSSNKGFYFRLVDTPGSEPKREKLVEAIQNPDCGWFYRADATTFHDIPGSPIAYWASNAVHQAFLDGSDFGLVASPRIGIKTGNNAAFVRDWWEVAFSSAAMCCGSTRDDACGRSSWFAYNKGGSFRRWYGNNSHVIYWKKGGDLLRRRAEQMGVTCSSIPENLQFKESVLCNLITSDRLSFRIKPVGILPDIATVNFYSNVNSMVMLAVGNSSLCNMLLSLLAPTLNNTPGDLAKLPWEKKLEEPGIQETIEELAKSSVALSQLDWDSQETSWDFKRNPLI